MTWGNEPNPEYVTTVEMLTRLSADDATIKKLTKGIKKTKKVRKPFTTFTPSAIINELRTQYIRNGHASVKDAAKEINELNLCY